MTVFLRLFGTVLAALALGGVYGVQALARPHLRRTAVSGSVVLSPASPVCRAGDSCTKPLAGITLIFSRRGKWPVRVQTDRRGRYRTALLPGSYAVATPAHRSGPGRGLAPRRIQIPALGSAIRNFTFDAGIR